MFSLKIFYQLDIIISLFMGNNPGLCNGCFGWKTLSLFTTEASRPNLYFWRSHDGLEVDLIIQIGQHLYPIEIKSSATPKAEFMVPVNQFKEIAIKASLSVTDGLMVCQAPARAPLPYGNNAFSGLAFINGSTINCLQQKKVFIHDGL